MLRLEEEDIYAGIATSGSGGGGDTPESAKGSFNASTQQLTLKYDYLVEKINSSDQLTAETKEFIIGRLKNSDVVVDMTRDTISTTGHSSDIAWCCCDGDPASEDLDELPTTMIFVSKSNPETIKFIIPADSGGLVFGSYNALRALYELQGQSLTAEEVEALLSSSVVDEEVLIISGTLGNFEVEFIEDTPVVEKFGATISNFLGDTDANGVLQAPTEEANLVFTGVKGLSDSALNSRFMSVFKIVKSVSFPDLETIDGDSALASAFEGGVINGYAYDGLTSISFPKLRTISGQYAFQRTFYTQGGITSVEFPTLSSLTGYRAFQYCFYSNLHLTSVSFPALKSDSFGTRTNQFNYMLQGVTGCTVHFPSNLQAVIGSWSDVTAGFGGTNTTVLFDLPATE